MSYRSDFPIFTQIPDLHYLDTSATSQKPKVVIDSLTEYYLNFNCNAGRGSHTLAIKSELIIKEARKKVADFIISDEEGDVVFTKNATEALNIVAFGYFSKILQKDDEIIIPISNHHANLVPWQEVCRATGAVLKYLPVDDNGDIDLNVYKTLVSDKTKLVSLAAMVNATGVINPVNEILKLAREVGAITLVDASQYIHHRRVNVKEMDCDFLVFSGHKIFSAFGVGVLYAKKKYLKEASAILYGGEMIEYVEKFKSTYKEAPNRFEGGTMDTAAIYSLNKAIDYIEAIGYDKISKYTDEIEEYALEEMRKIPQIELYAVNAKDRAGVIAFNVKGVHSHDTAHILNEFGVILRSGHHCTQPLMCAMNFFSCCRISFSIYNEKKDIDALILGIKKVIEIFQI